MEAVARDCGKMRINLLSIGMNYYAEALKAFVFVSFFVFAVP